MTKNYFEIININREDDKNSNRTYKKFKIRTVRSTKNKPTQMSGFLYLCEINEKIKKKDQILISNTENKAIV
jgi:hypothetical protein